VPALRMTFQRQKPLDNSRVTFHRSSSSLRTPLRPAKMRMSCVLVFILQRGDCYETYA
jgi:hypothetical protein